MITLQPKAKRDLRKIGPGPHQQRIVDGLKKLDHAKENMDIKALVGQSPWLRLRIGTYRIIYRDVETEAGIVHVIARIIHRRDLDKTAANLPEVTDP